MVQRYAEVNGNTLIKYPYLFSDLQADNPDTNYGDNYDVAYWYPQTQKAKDTGNSLAAVTQEIQPVYDPATQNCVLRDAPELLNGRWVIYWVVSDKTPAEKQQYIDAWRAATSCSPFQGRMALIDANLFTQAEAAVNAGDDKTKTAWEYALIWERTSPMIESLAQALGLSDTQVDDLFKAAQEIQA